MSKPKHQDPELRAKKAERRKRRRAAVAAGAQMLPRKPRPTAQMDHGSNARGAKKAREGERAMARDRADVPTLDEARERRGQPLA